MLDSDLAKLYDTDTKKLKYSYAPIMVFSEQGVSKLSSVLHSKRAIYANIEIMKAFVSYRAMMIENKELKNEIIRLDKKINNSFKFLLKKIDALTPVLPRESRKTVGFKRKDQS